MVVSAAARTSLRLSRWVLLQLASGVRICGTRGVRTERRGAGHGDLASGVSCRYGNGGGRQNLTDRSLVRPHSCMMVRSRARLIPVAAIGLICGLPSIADDETGKILRPANNSSHTSGPIDLVATALSGKLQMDGIAIEVERPFPDVLHASVNAPLECTRWFLCGRAAKRKCISLLVRILPRTFQPFHQHPPIAGVQCTQCHGLNRRGRFVSKGGCFDCHRQDDFAKVHTHEPAVLERCRHVPQPTWIYGGRLD